MKSVWKQIILGTAVALLTLQVQAQTSGEPEKPEKRNFPERFRVRIVLKEQRERFEKRMEHRPPMGEHPEGGMRPPHEGGM